MIQNFSSSGVQNDARKCNKIVLKNKQEKARFLSDDSQTPYTQNIDTNMQTVLKYILKCT